MKTSLTEDTLREIGLTPKEAKMYLALLSMGVQSASVLAGRLGVGRSTAQFLAESLVKKEFAYKKIRQKITYYEALEPQKLPEVLARQKAGYLAHLEEKNRKLNQVLPALEAVTRQAPEETRVSFFDGVQGVKKVYEDALTSTQTIRTFVSLQNRESHLPNYFPHYYERRTKKGVRVRAIYPDTPFGQESKRHAAEYLREAKLIDPTRYTWEPEIQFYDNKVTIASFREQIGIIIESEVVAQAMKALFDLAWDNTPAPEEERRA